jgi:hypothetical protein
MAFTLIVSSIFLFIPFGLLRPMMLERVHYLLVLTFTLLFLGGLVCGLIWLSSSLLKKNKPPLKIRTKRLSRWANYAMEMIVLFSVLIGTVFSLIFVYEILAGVIRGVYSYNGECEVTYSPGKTGGRHTRVYPFWAIRTYGEKNISLPISSFTYRRLVASEELVKDPQTTSVLLPSVTHVCNQDIRFRYIEGFGIFDIEFADTTHVSEY